MFKRPSPADTDEDLQKFQEQFLASKSKPAAKYVHSKDASFGDIGSSCSICTKKDIVTLDKLPSQTAPKLSAHHPKRNRFKRSRVEAEPLPDEDPEAVLDKHDSHITKVLTEIVEREFNTVPPCYPSANTTGGFPKVIHRGDVKQQEPAEKGRKRCSLFAQQFAKSTAADFGLASLQRAVLQENEVLSKFVKERHPVCAIKVIDTVIASSEFKQIHVENQARLQSMTDEEIRREQKYLLDNLDPEVISFLKSRSQQHQEQNGQTEKLSQGAPHHSSVENKLSMSTKIGCTADVSTAGYLIETGDEVVGVEKSPSDETVIVPDGQPVLKPPSKWLHMDKLEPEKLEWMKDLPAPAADDNSTGKPARFDLSGDLVNANVSIPTHLGLHHHGEEPERAGYTLSELFHLSRSANIQQRALALNTLAKVIRKAKEGIFHECVSTALIPAMVSGGLVFILRWALDDKTDNTMSAAVNALHALTVSLDDECSLDNTLCWYRGYEMSCLCPEPLKTDGPDEKLSDAELVKADLVKGLLQMSLLPRLRYIVEVWQPPRITVVQILDILIRICRHSLQSAYEVFKCPRLLDTIFREFLTWKIPEPWPDPLVMAYGLPCSRALKLIRVLCMASRNMASHVIANHSLMDGLLLYISQGQQQTGGYHAEMHELMLESYRTWKVCVMYGLGIQHFRDCYPMLIEQLKTSCQLAYNSEYHSLQLACTLISFLESVVHAAAKTTHYMMTKIQKTNVSPSSEMEHTVAPFIPELDWSHVSGLIEPILICVQRQLRELCEFYIHDKYDLSLTACYLNFIASWVERATKIPKQAIVDILHKMESFCKESLVPVIHSLAFSNAVAAVRKHSVILCAKVEKKSNNLSSLPDVCSLVGDKALECPILQKGSTIHFVLAFVRVCNALKILRSLTDVYSVLLNEPELVQYLRQLCRVKQPCLASNYFAQFENRLQLGLINMTLHVGKGFDVALYHQVALNLLTHIHEGSEYDVHQLLSSVIFNPDLLSDLKTAKYPSLAASLSDQLQLQTPAKIISATKEEIIIDKTQLLNDMHSNLPLIRNTYLASFSGNEKAVHQSKIRCEDSMTFAETLILGRCAELLVPVDWVFLPLIEIYNTTCNLSSKPPNENSSLSESVAKVTNSMRFIYLIEEYRTERLEMIAFTVRLSRLMCVFLAGSNLFLHSQIQCYLMALLQHYCKPAVLDRMDFTKPVPGLSSFYDFYVMLLEQFAAVSFGDWLFSSYIILPLQQRHSIIFRRAIWGEFSIVLRSLHLKVNQVAVPLERFLEPEESELELLRLYFQALMSEMVSASRTPLPYLIAVHHVNRFIFNQQQKHKKMAQFMIKHVFCMTDSTLQKHLLFYKLPNKDKEHGMELYESLPINRQALLDTLRQS